MELTFVGGSLDGTRREVPFVGKYTVYKHIVPELTVQEAASRLHDAKYVGAVAITVEIYKIKVIRSADETIYYMLLAGAVHPLGESAWAIRKMIDAYGGKR